MWRIVCLFLLFSCFAVFAASGNLLKDPLKISNPGATTYKDGVYTFTTADDKSRCELVQTVTMDQKTPGPVTFAIEGCGIEENARSGKGYFGVYLTLNLADGSRINAVNFGVGKGVFPWQSRSRVFRAGKPVKTVTYRVCYNYIRGKVSVRRPQLYDGAVAVASGRLSTQPFGKHRIGVAKRYTDTWLVRSGSPSAALVGDPALCAEVNKAIKEKTGTVLPVLPHTAYEHAETIDRNLIVIGNRENNRTSSNLYFRHYSLIDARYPGPGGSDLHSVHNPLGDGHNIIIAGGSDAAGDKLAVQKLCKHIRQAAAGKDLKLGYISDATLSPAYKVARDVKDIPLWGSCFGNGKDSFGWNSLARNLAMLYITNDPYYKNEFMRLAFPKDKATRDELFRRDGEAYKDNFSEPIVQIYHYRAVKMVMYWDLVNANPLFTDAERQKVDERFYQQLASRAPHLGVHLGKETLVRPDRHRTWEALTVYATARYLHKAHPCFDTREGLRIGRNAMEPLFRTPMIGNIAFFWLPTSVQLQLYYASLQGNRLVGSPAMQAYANLLTMTSTLGKGTDARVEYRCPLVVFPSAAALAQDQGPFRLLMNKAFSGNYSKSKEDLSVFRLGRSFWVSRPYSRDSIRDNAGKWTSFASAHPSGPGKTELFYTSFRSKPDESGDFLLIDPHYSTGLRDMQHNFAMVFAHLGGMPLLYGYQNAVVPYINGLASGTYPFDARIVTQGAEGDFVWITGRVENFNGFDWERTWLLRKGLCLIAIDRMTAKKPALSARFEATFAAGLAGKVTALPDGDFAMRTWFNGKNGEFIWSCSEDCPVRWQKSRWGVYLPGDEVIFMPVLQPVKTGSVKSFVTLLRPGKPLATRSTARKGDVFALATPEPALLKLTDGGFVFTDAKETFTLKNGKAVRSSGDPAGAAEAEKMLASRKRAPYVPAGLPEKTVAPVWKNTVSGRVGQAVTAGEDMLIATGKTVRLLNLADGREHFRRTFEKDIASLAWHPEAGLYLVGTMDEKLYALDAAGKVSWTFVSQMPPELLRYGPYWHKRSVPGVRSLLVHKGLVYAGSASTVEILDAKGALQARKFILYGGVDDMFHDPVTGSVLLIRPSGGAAVHSIDAKMQVKMLSRWGLGLQDALSRYGFNQVGQLQLAFFRNAAGEWRAANILAGAQNRLVIRKPDGTPLFEADFGSGSLGRTVQIPNSGQRTLRNMALADLDGNGVPEICVAHAKGTCFIFNDRAEVCGLHELNGLPLSLASDGKAFYAGMDDGRILRIGQKGPVVIGRLKGQIFVLETLSDGRLFAGSSSGETACFKF